MTLVARTFAALTSPRLHTNAHPLPRWPIKPYVARWYRRRAHDDQAQADELSTERADRARIFAENVSKARKRFESERLGDFVDHYARLGLGPQASMREVADSLETLVIGYHRDRTGLDDPTALRNALESRRFLLDAEKRSRYDVSYEANASALQWIRRDDIKSGIIPASAAVVESPTLEVPANQTRSTVVLLGLPPQTTIKDVVRGVAAIGQPIGRILHVKVSKPTAARETISGQLEFSNNAEAALFNRIAKEERRFYVLEKEVASTCLEVPSAQSISSRFSNGKVIDSAVGASRLLLVGGSGQESIMTAEGMHAFLSAHLNDVSGRNLDDVQDWAKIVRMADGSGNVVMELCFLTWREGALIVKNALEKHHPHLLLTYGIDPCEESAPPAVGGGAGEEASADTASH